MKLTFNLEFGRLAMNGLEIGYGFREEFLKTAMIGKFTKEATNASSAYSEYVISPVLLWDWRFTIILHFKSGFITHAQLLWMDSDLASRESWEEIVMADLPGDFKKLYEFIRKEVSPEAIHLTRENAVWKFPWGSIAIWTEDRSYTEGISISWLSPRETTSIT